ncbi:hypothetical protein [Rhizobium sp. PL01]|uniref:hypothetical protein n=1 Tax=Rhizobium sp. PL01 TaxID=3085631 RepID=UPI002980A463|nr:hypothetical protein [Rhizobium sp. PL01]MDW5316429.1 hypothetical protein [Rhizobium sp. PL01]
MQDTHGKEPNPHFAVIYRYFDDIDTALQIAAARNVDMLIIRTQKDGGDPSWRPGTGTCVLTDLETQLGYEHALAALDTAVPDGVIFSVESDRDLNFLQMTAREAEFVKEVMLRRIGAKGRIITYPLHHRIPPQVKVAKQDVKLSSEEIDARLQALMADKKAA